jgi:hypothetical protein
VLEQSTSIVPLLSLFCRGPPLDIKELLPRNVGFTVCSCVCPLYVLLIDVWKSPIPQLKSHHVLTSRTNKTTELQSCFLSKTSSNILKITIAVLPDFK